MAWTVWLPVIRALTAASFDPREGEEALVGAIEARDVALMTYLEGHGAREKA